MTRAPESLMSNVEARDDHTLVITWKELYTGANALGYRQLHPMASHLLEQKYRTNHANEVKLTHNLLNSPFMNLLIVNRAP